jgi:hypothetical protein
MATVTEIEMMMRICDIKMRRQYVITYVRTDPDCSPSWRIGLLAIETNIIKNNSSQGRSGANQRRRMRHETKHAQGSKYAILKYAPLHQLQEVQTILHRVSVWLCWLKPVRTAGFRLMDPNGSAHFLTDLPCLRASSSFSHDRPSFRIMSF